MKKKTSSILLLSAFAALVLAGCNTPASSSAPAESLGTSVPAEESKPEESAPVSTPASTTSQGTSTPASSSSSKPASSPAASSSSKPASSSSATPSSSRPKTWTEMGVVGEYKGGMTSLIVNADGTTSWGTSTTRHPATLTEVGGGVYHIVSASSVPAEDKVDVYTDGTMAHVVHDEESLDNYVMDKGATGASATAFAETEDESKFFGGVELTSGHWKYFANLNGVYHFGVTVTLQAGTNINGGGAIFQVTAGGATTTFRVTEEAANAGAFATVEAFNLTVTTYTGDNGDLTVGKTDSGELAFVKLDGTELVGATLDGDVITVKGEESTIEVNEEGTPVRRYSATTYTLQTIARRYTRGTGTVDTELLDKLTGTSGTYGVDVDESGHLWAAFTAPASGKLTVTETSTMPNASGTGTVDTCMWFFDAAAYPYTNTSFSSLTNGCLAYNDNGVNPPHIDNFTVTRGQTIVIKIGYYSNAKVGIGQNGGAAYAGLYEEISYDFTPFTQETYTSADGDTLSLEKDGNDVKTITLNGVSYKEDSFEIAANGDISLSSSIIDPEDPTGTSTLTTVVTCSLDASNNTFTMSSESHSSMLFHPLTVANPTYSGVSGEDGAMWTVFVAPADGFVTANASDWPGVDDVLDCYIYDPTTTNVSNWTSSNYFKHSDHTTSMEPESLEDIPVEAGKMYVFKQYAYGKFKQYGVDCNDATLKGVPLSISITYSQAVTEVYTCAGSADVKLTFKDGDLYEAKLGTTTLTGAALNEDGTALIIKGTATIDTTTDPANPTMTSTDTIYTFDKTAGTYVKTTPTNTDPIFKPLDETSTQLAGITGNDANIWGKFTPTQDGFITLREKVSCYPTYTTYIIVYEQDSTPAATDYSGYTASTYPCVKTYASSSFNTKPASIENFPVQAGHTYIIKAGYGSSYNYTGSAYSAKGVQETVSFSYTTPTVGNYTGPEGALAVTTLSSGELYKVTLTNDAGAVDEYKEGEVSADGTTVTVTKTWIDNSDPTGPQKVLTTKTFTLDNEHNTYTVETTNVPSSLFTALTAAEPTVTDVTGEDGSIWAMFKAPNDGTLTVTAGDMAGDDILQVWAFDGTVDPATFVGTTTGGNLIASADTPEPCSITLSVQAGKTYVFKHCLWSNRSVGYGQEAAPAAVGLASSITINYVGYTADEYTDADGNVIAVNSLGTTYKSTSYNGQPFNATRSGDGLTYTQKGTATPNEEGDLEITWTDSVYTLNPEDHTFTRADDVHTVAIVQGTMDAVPGTVDAATLANGSAVAKFIAPADGSVTFTATFQAGVDPAMGIYTDRMCTTLATGATLQDRASNTAETMTINVVAGQTYYIKAAPYQVKSRALTDLTASSSYVGKTVTFTVA